MLATIEIPFKGSGHGDGSRRLQNIGFLGQRISEARRLYVRRTEQRVALLSDVGNREDLAIAESDQAFAKARFGFVMRKPGGTLASAAVTFPIVS